ncbi:hypothetical protein NDU88_001741 [Pleurodeles waltl]|uniref:Mitochondrial cardiolipin hydrolase n=1 Tax=Pleurodeles waltl TaxID=8319 RepID=A0AAV7LYH5_PLEWA|nr:hypothetical protein NDU88_001741 [Pleurodeles waltl]
MQEARIDTSLFGAHRMRGAVASKAFTVRARLEEIMKAADRSSDSTFKRSYLKPFLECCLFGGIIVRHDQDTGYMHHKFAVVDKKILITGSLNWTSQAIQGNKENILVVDDTVIVQAFIDEFEKLWELYNPATFDFFPNGKNSSPTLKNDPGYVQYHP